MSILILSASFVYKYGANIMIFADTGKFLLVVFLKKLVRHIIFPYLCANINTTPKMKIEIATIEDVPEIL